MKDEQTRWDCQDSNQQAHQCASLRAVKELQSCENARRGRIRALAIHSCSWAVPPPTGTACHPIAHEAHDREHSRAITTNKQSQIKACTSEPYGHESTRPPMALAMVKEGHQELSQAKSDGGTEPEVKWRQSRAAEWIYMLLCPSVWAHAIAVRKWAKCETANRP